MPTVTVERSVTLQETAKALEERLGNAYEVSTQGTGSQEALKVKHSAASLATVKLDQGDKSTTFHVHGGGLVISRMVNELGIAKKVAGAIQESFSAGGTAPPAQGMAPPAEGMAPPAEGMAPPAEGMAPPQGMAPPAQGMAPPAGGVAPPPDDTPN